MIRWLPILAFACTACSPAEKPDSALALCQRVEERCIVTVERSDFWREPPLELASNESVVQVAYLGGYATITHSPSSDYPQKPSGEIERACTQVTPVAVHHYRVTRVVSGDFDAPEFMLLAQGGFGCDSDKVALGLKANTNLDYRLAFLVIRPAELADGAFPQVGFRPGPDGIPVEFTLPRMMHRAEGARP
ncbi:MAG: hypothetical protein Q8R82_01400 [Hyphomonadaceae bacterium]|nr:hypothetical protein [Hyphomonadaceae bacterium]